MDDFVSNVSDIAGFYMELLLSGYITVPVIIMILELVMVISKRDGKRAKIAKWMAGGQVVVAFAILMLMDSPGEKLAEIFYLYFRNGSFFLYLLPVYAIWALLIFLLAKDKSKEK